ncbi:MAG: site-specific DNA-methyltransferase [Betaproteobacteria bacterium]|nr:site-specific DNA-methyltransferase [Betaproteobacteria bacterium]
MLEFEPALSAGSLQLRGIAVPSRRARVREVPTQDVPIYQGELWTAMQRQASSIHEIAYRACYKPQLPAYFIERLTEPGDVVYDPFSGRGTTAVEAALHGRNVIANDANPLSALLTQPRLELPDLADIEARLNTLRFKARQVSDIDLSMFYHRDTERELLALRTYLMSRQADYKEDAVDRWIRMVATNRLTGHSPGFFSVYTLPPNQAASPDNQIKINERLKQKPEYRDVRELILRKSKQLQGKLKPIDRERLRAAAETAAFMADPAAGTLGIPSEIVKLTVTSPPFLDVVQYAKDNWLRCWFNALDAEYIAARITMSSTVAHWSTAMLEVFRELYRVTVPNGWVAFEVGEVRGGKIKLDEIVAPIGIAAGFACMAVAINAQKFTKTANIWGVANNAKGTNSNRIVLFRKPV